MVSALGYERSGPGFKSRGPQFRFFIYVSKMKEK